FCAIKSGCNDKIRCIQQSILLGSISLFFPLHNLQSPISPSLHNPLSIKTCRIPLGSFGYCGWSDGKIIDCDTLFDPKNVERICGCFPPGLTFIFAAFKPSSGIAP